MHQVGTILIVDDLPVVRQALTGMLANEGHRILQAEGGLQALAQAHAEMPDLVLLDVQMPPGIDGFETCRRFRRDPRLRDIPIIMVTTLADRDSRLRGIEAGADDFVSKPVDSTELRVRIRSLLRLNRFRTLLDAQARFAWVVEHADVGYVWLTPDEHITAANPCGMTMLDIPSSYEPDRLHFRELAERHYRLEPAERWEGDWPAPGAPPRLLIRPATSQGGIWWLEATSRVEERTGVRLVRLRDVTREQQQEREIRSFHSLISHKLNTPLNGIVGATSFLMQPDWPIPDDERQELTRLAHDAAVRLAADVAGVLRYLKTWSRTPADGDWVAAVELPDVVARAADALRLTSVETTITDAAEEAVLACSRQPLDVILHHLLDNSRKFHPSRTPHITIHADLQDGVVRLDVQDDGVALSPQQLAHAWTPYMQGDLRTTGEVPGMGLGLALVQSFVWEAGGTCALANRHDRPGVVVTLRIPVHAPPEEYASPEAIATPS